MNVIGGMGSFLIIIELTIMEVFQTLAFCVKLIPLKNEGAHSD